MHRPLCPTGADHLLVRDALADGGYFSGSAPAARVRNPAALVGASDPEDCSGAVGTLLAGYALRTPANRRGLLCSIMAKVQLRRSSRKPAPSLGASAVSPASLLGARLQPT